MPAKGGNLSDVSTQEFDFLASFEKAVQKKDTEQQVAILQKALNEHGFKSAIMSDLALAVANHGLPYIAFLEAFCDENAETPHGAEIKLADFYAGLDKLDETTARARRFVSKFRGTDSEKNLSKHPTLLTMFARCYLLMTAAYTRLGARSYSKRLLSKAISLGLPQAFEDRMKNEIQLLDSELKTDKNLALDKKWEEFYQTGTNYSELYELCKAQQYPQMAKRIELIEGQFRFDSNFKVEESEMLMDIFAFRKNNDEKEALSFALR